MSENFPVVQVELIALAFLTGLYFLLALFRVADVELSRLRMGSALRQAGRDDRLLERWSSSRHGDLLPLGAQVSFQGTLVLASVIIMDLLGRLLPSMALVPRLLTGFALTFLILVILVRLILVRILFYVLPQAAVKAGGRVASVASILLFPLLIPLESMLRGLAARADLLSEERSETEMEEEVSAFVSMGEEEGILEKEEGDLVRNVVDFGDTIVREIMTPRTDMVVVDRGSRLSEAQARFISAKHSRIPVQNESVDHIDGVLNIKDLLPVWSEKGDGLVADFIRPVMFVPETKRIFDLLREMQKAQAPFAIVVDEYGGTAGLVTVEDIVEELVGEIQDEHEELRADVEEESPGTWLVPGFLDVERVAALVGLDVNGTDVETIGGMVTGIMGRVPEPGESLTHDGIRIEILAADGRRILKLRLRRQVAAAGSAG